MSGHSLSVTDECPLCGGPCREAWRLGPIHDNYPFMNPEAIRMTQERAEVEVAEAPPVEPRRGKRSHRLREDRAHRPVEDR